MTNPNSPDPATSSAERPSAHVILVPGFWLGAWAWQDVEPTLQEAGIATYALTLPGLDGTGTDGITLADHIDAVCVMVDTLTADNAAGPGRPHGDHGVDSVVDGGVDGNENHRDEVVPTVLVGHSGGGPVVQGVIDRHPELINRVIYVDSGPMKEGVVLFPDADDDLPLPPWPELAAQGSSIEGMDESALARFRERAVPHPAGVVTSPVALTNPDRLDVPASLICTSYSSKMLIDLIDSGRLPSELGSVTDVTYVDLPTGHWPMFSRPKDLAAALRDEILR